ncbi:TetR/AcrR family transcriptional regulator [Lentzea sp. JNUCC 0626]|uniref:TetR/AcrR family transcriptional regulator n=1 Tax=Lentzea sp. JNUCC 0626 TaxID=3367513 RepID=UPI003749C5C5
MTARQMDPRSRRSRAALEVALRHLVEERELGRISISDVTKLAEVNRSTFYDHYADLDELAASACTATFDELLADAPLLGEEFGSGAGAAFESLSRMFVHVAEHSHLYRTLLGPDGSARVINHLLDRMVGAACRRREALRFGSAGPAGDPHDPLDAVLAGAVLGSIAYWLRHGCPGAARDVAAAIWPQLVNVSLRDKDLAARPGPELDPLNRSGRK